MPKAADPIERTLVDPLKVASPKTKPAGILKDTIMIDQVQPSLEQLWRADATGSAVRVAEIENETKAGEAPLDESEESLLDEDSIDHSGHLGNTLEDEDDDDEKAAVPFDLLDSTVPLIREAISSIGDITVLLYLHDAESAGRARKGALLALDERMALLDQERGAE
jgi:hypothetical protein